LRKFFISFFFGNYFYACCAVALSIETCFYFNYGPLQWLPLGIIFMATLIYYNLAYIKAATITSNAGNYRSSWYTQHITLLKKLQLLFILLCSAAIIYFVILYSNSIIRQKPKSLCIIGSVFVLSALYYPNTLLGNYSIRTLGWAKPFLIAYVWSGVVTLLPLFGNAVITNSVFYVTPKLWLYTGVNFVFIAALSILFDVKDYTDDYNVNVKTLALQLGTKKVINYVVVPLLLLACMLQMAYLKLYHNATYEILLVPFYITVITQANKLLTEKSILYYLIIIDGLMLLKALLGIFIVL
jgi:4-hydroxybenzoate polyprenyltransferase